MKIPTRLILLCTLCMGIGFSACEKDLPIKSNDKAFNVELFKKALQDSLKEARGYQIVINKGGRWVDTATYGIGGFDRSGATYPASVYSEVNIASVTKTFTAVAALKLMAEQDLTIEDEIADWLPDTWSKNSQISSLKFRELLTHTSGIRESSTNWDSLKKVVMNVLEGPKTTKYANANLALFRAMIPKMANPGTFTTKENSLSAADFEKWMGEEYVKLMNSLVFEPAGVTAVCMPDPNKTTNMLMNEAPAELGGYTEGDWTQVSGGGGFFLTTMDLARMLAFLTHSDAVIGQTIRTIMDTKISGYNIGWTSRIAVKDGIAYGHDGALSRPSSQGTVGLQTYIVKFPNTYALALSINSIPVDPSTPNQDYRILSRIVKAAYDNAWQ